VLLHIWLHTAIKLQTQYLRKHLMASLVLTHFREYMYTR